MSNYKKINSGHVSRNNYFDPRRAIIPIVKINPEGIVSQLLGTGFFVGKGEIPIVVTAKHVFQNNPLEKNESYGLECYGTGKKAITEVAGLRVCDTYDIAMFYSGLLFEDPISSKLAKLPTPMNVDVFTYEYSASREITDQNGHLSIQLDAFSHKGNIMRYYESDFPEKIPTQSFDTSFPALQGASGAPVIRSTDHAVVGMLVANHERHLIPAQTVKIQYQDGEYEETNYFLPTGKAIVSDLIIQFLTKNQIEVEFVE